MFRGSELVQCWLPSYQSGGLLVSTCSGQLSLCVSVAWSCPPSLHLDSSLAQCFAVGVCFCFDQLLDEGSMMVDKLVIDLREGHLW